LQLDYRKVPGIRESTTTEMPSVQNAQSRPIPLLEGRRAISSSRDEQEIREEPTIPIADAVPGGDDDSESLHSGRTDEVPHARLREEEPAVSTVGVDRVGGGGPTGIRSGTGELRARGAHIGGLESIFLFLGLSIAAVLRDE